MRHPEAAGSRAADARLDRARALDCKLVLRVLAREVPQREARLLSTHRRAQLSHPQGGGRDLVGPMPRGRGVGKD